MRKPGTKSAGATASSQERAPSSSTADKGKQTTAATTNVLATDSKAQAALLAKLMVQVQEQRTT